MSSSDAVSIQPSPPRAPPRTPRKPRKPRKRRRGNTFRKRLERWRKRAAGFWRPLAAVPPAIRTLLFVSAVLVLFVVANTVYQVVRKPTEMFFPVSDKLNKMPSETWREYGPLFRQYSTATITPELLAALAQHEAAGNPVARTYWRWRLTADPFGIYKPASSAVGMYQMTDPAFTDARHYCIRHHTVVEASGLDDWDGCWFNGLYMRVMPSHAIELAAIYLDRSVDAILDDLPNRKATSRQLQDMAIIVHLCGAGPARAFAHHGFRLLPGERCGDHSAAAYLADVNGLKRQFEKLAAE